MLRTLIISCFFVVVSAIVATSQDAQGYSKRILGKWVDDRSGKVTIFHANGFWGMQPEDQAEEIHGHWRIKGNKLFLTYADDSGVGTRVHIRTGRYTISFAGDDRFTTETQGYKDVYDRVR
jgi:hypothetical protein